MKKLTIFTLFILLLAACNSPQETSPKDTDGSSNVSEEVKDDLEDETNREVDEATQNDEPEVTEEMDENQTEAPAQENESSNNNATNEHSPSEKNEEPEGNEHDELVELTNNIFNAQFNKDYDFLQSILSKGSKLDKENNKFMFENVTYPHEQALFTEKTAGDLEFRYTNENNADSVVVGFAAVDYEKEYSFVIDFEFVQEDGKWKMNDMDVNK
ncbi:hypothetical protein ACFSKI_12615 [Pseudogracilibacillus auburnensis]|uniref:Uncharacterized protein n=1 Tax=Pseudogracilibacillus auburnensis TaxID=1494959 RepID=A0A2V3WDP1_9BACI|nr:hypothetical protein [Pseudogracilibacillus auburnensis]MBO1003664.1 hypothetical protein [Pseudogracilibacillus auburnensis]PXW90325.1 hypothetical protein DFR56_101237 [Pseudogracilibacillus auburnensis]